MTVYVAWNSVIKILAALAVTALAVPVAPAHADSDAELAFLSTLNAFGLYVADTEKALAFGYEVCDKLDYRNGTDVAFDYPDPFMAAKVVVAAATNLCTRNWHPERMRGFVA